MNITTTTVAGGLVTVSSFCHFVESSKPTPFPLQSELFTLILFTDEETEAPRDDVTGPSSQWALSSLFWGAYIYNSMDRGAWWAIVHGIKKSDVTEQLTLPFGLI